MFIYFVFKYVTLQTQTFFPNLSKSFMLNFFHSQCNYSYLCYKTFGMVLKKYMNQRHRLHTQDFVPNLLHLFRTKMQLML